MLIGDKVNLLPVSIVIPTYNRAHLICRAVESALAASSPGDEIIVVDDGSTDDTEKVLAPHRDRIRYLRIPNGGAGAARNYGVKEAKHPLVAFLDSDDAWMPDKLYLQRMIMQSRPDIVLSCSDFMVVNSSGEVVHRFRLSAWHGDQRSWDDILAPGIPFSSIAPLPQGRQDFSTHIGDLYLPLMRALYVCVSTAIIRKDIVGEALRFPEDLRIYEDWECFGRVARFGPTAYLACETIWYYDHTGHRVTDVDDELRERNRFIILDRVWESDAEFSKKHRRALDEERLIKLKYFLGQGKRKEAREELRSLKKCPLLYQFLAVLPGSVTRGLLFIRRNVRRTLIRASAFLYGALIQAC